MLLLVVVIVCLGYTWKAALEMNLEIICRASTDPCSLILKGIGDKKITTLSSWKSLHTSVEYALWFLSIPSCWMTLVVAVVVIKSIVPCPDAKKLSRSNQDR